MAKVGAQRAAELTGKSKSTIQRAMKSGKVSFEMDNNGRRVIDVAELDRAFGLKPQETEQNEKKAVEAELEKATQMLDMERLKMRIKMLEDQLDIAEERIEDLKSQRDSWQNQAQQTMITSQYSQKEAEEYRGKLKEREERARIRRQQEMERRMQHSRAQNQNSKAGPISRQKKQGDKKKNASGSLGLDIQGLWGKIRGQDDQSATDKKSA